MERMICFNGCVCDFERHQAENVFLNKSLQNLEPCYWKKNAFLDFVMSLKNL